MATQKTWTMNDTQKAFVKEVRNAGKDGITIFELKVQGKNFATGAINALAGKGVLAKNGEREYKCDIVYNGVKVGETTKTGVVFILGENAPENDENDGE